MTRKAKQVTTIVGAVGLGILLIPGTARAIIPVFDAGSYLTLGRIFTSDASLLTKATQALAQGAKLLKSTLQTETLARQAGTMVHTPNRSLWQTIGNLVSANTTPNDTGATAGWSQAMNGQGNVIHSFVSATEGIAANPGYPSAVAAHGSLAAVLAGANIADGAILTTMRTVSQTRTNQAATDAAIKALEKLSTSTATADNTQEATLNVISGATVQNLRMQQSNQALATSVAESTLPMMKLWRDEQVSGLNFNTQIQHTLKNSASFPGGMANTFASRY